MVTSREASKTLAKQKTSKFAFLNKFKKNEGNKAINVEIVKPDDIVVDIESKKEDQDEFKSLI